MARAAFPDMVVTVHDSVVGGDVVAVHAQALKRRGVESFPFALLKTVALELFDAAIHPERRYGEGEIEAAFGRTTAHPCAAFGKQTLNFRQG